MTTQSLQPPWPLKAAGVIAIVQALLGFLFAGLLIIRQLRGESSESLVYETEGANTLVGAGTAIFFIIIFGVVLLGAVCMIRGKRWGRGPVIMLEMLLLPISYYMFSGGQLVLAIVVALSALLGLVMAFHPLSVQWAAQRYLQG